MRQRNLRRACYSPATQIEAEDNLFWHRPRATAPLRHRLRSGNESRIPFVDAYFNAQEYLARH